MEKQDESVQGTQAWGKPAPAALPDPASAQDDATIEQKAARLEQLTQGQLYLSKEEVFAQDILDEAFVSTDGVDLRNSLAIKNVETATLLSNWLDTDTLIRAVFVQDRNYASKLRSLGSLPAADIDTLEGMFARLAAENPMPKTQAEAMARYNAKTEVPDTLGFAPANFYLNARTQFAIRLAWIINSARACSAMDTDMRRLAYLTAREKEPGLTAAEFGTRIGLNMVGISGVRRRVHGIGGNFFRDLGRSISRFFKNPLAGFRRMAIEIGKGLMQLEKPFIWIRSKIPFFGYIQLDGLFATVFAELGRALVSGSISSFTEQRVAFVLGNFLSQAGAVLTLIGGVLTLTPLSPIGKILAIVGMLMVVAGTAILQAQALMIQQRKNREAYLLRMRELERLKKLKQNPADEFAEAAAQTAPGAKPANGMVLVAGAIVAFLLFR